jgi:hypothetical protein
MKKTYLIKPTMTPQTVIPASTLDKPALARVVPPRQPLPMAVLDPTKPMLKLGLDAAHCLAGGPASELPSDHDSRSERRMWGNHFVAGLGGHNQVGAPVPETQKRKRKLFRTGIILPVDRSGLIGVRLLGHAMMAPPLPVYPNLWAEEIPDVRARRKAEDETSASLKSK